MGSFPPEGSRIEQREKLSFNSVSAKPYPSPWDALKFRWLFRAGARVVEVRGPGVSQSLNASCPRKVARPWS